MSIHDHRYTKDLVPTIALISRLSINNQQLDSYSETFDKIIDMFEQMDQCDTDDIQLSDFIVSSESSLRLDVPSNVDTTDFLAQNMPNFQGGYFKVPKVIE